MPMIQGSGGITYMKRWLQSSVLAVTVTAGAFNSIAAERGNPRAMSVSASDPVRLTATNKGPFKYFQIQAANGAGISGEIFLNGVSVFKMTAVGGQISNNQAQDLIKSGDNLLEVRIAAVGDQVGTATFSKEALDIGIHALNESGMPSNDNRVIHVSWSPSPKDKGPVTLTYIFALQRSADSPTSTSNSKELSPEDKELCITALLARQRMLQSGDMTAVRKYYLQALPEEQGVAGMSEAEVAGLAKMGTEQLNGITTENLHSSDTKWARTGENTIMAKLPNGRVVSVKKVGNAWQ
jgi:hypothetical protein